MLTNVMFMLSGGAIRRVSSSRARRSSWSSEQNIIILLSEWISVSVMFSGRVKTGKQQVSSTSAVTLPTSSRSLVSVPRVPMTISRGLLFLAHSAIASSGTPSTISCVNLTGASFACLISSRNVSARRSIFCRASVSSDSRISVADMS